MQGFNWSRINRAGYLSGFDCRRDRRPDELPPDLGKFILKVKQFAKQPVCVGFGISTPEQAVQVAKPPMALSSAASSFNDGNR